MNESTGAAGADFLGRIVDKALGRDGGLRPRVPSLFEPVFHAGIGTAEGSQAAAATGEAADDTLPSLHEHDGVRLRHAVRVTEAQPDRPVIHSRPPEPAPLAASRTEAVSASPVPFAVVHVPSAVALPSIRDDYDTSALPRASAVHVPHAGAGDARRSAAVGPSVAATADETASSDRRLRQNGALTPSFDRNTHAIAAEPQAMHRRPAAQQSHPEYSAVGMEPVVNVTIGRIEVRAAVQPAPAPRRIEARGQRPMSLDDYLKRRGSGR
jgi:hypothetical protein